MISFNVIVVISLEHIGHLVEMSVSGYSDRRFKSRLHQYVVFLSKTLNTHCISQLRCAMSTRPEHPREGCLCSGMSFLEEVALKIQRICKILLYCLFRVPQLYLLCFCYPS